MSWTEILTFGVVAAFVLLSVFWLGVLIGRNEQLRDTVRRIRDHVKREERNGL